MYIKLTSWCVYLRRSAGALLTRGRTSVIQIRYKRYNLGMQKAKSGNTESLDLILIEVFCFSQPLM